jgi:hypothetical protein
MKSVIQSHCVNAMARTAAVVFTGMSILNLISTASAQTHALEVAPPDVTAQQGFGDSICASGNLFAVGSQFDDTKGNNAGVVHVFNATTGVRVQKVFAPPAEAGANDQFGAAVAAGGAILAVGAPGEASGGSQRGAVHLYNLQTGAFLRTLRAPEARDDDHFGFSLAIDGDLLVIGAPDRDDKAIPNGGAIYIYNFRSKSFTPATGPAWKLAIANAGMGFSVAIEGTTVVTGAPGDVVGGVVMGSIHIIDAETHEPLAHGTPADMTGGSRFGHSVAIARGLVFAGAPLFDSRGKVYKARLSAPTNFVEFVEGAYSGEFAGWSLATGAQFMAIGVPGWKSQGASTDPATGGIWAYDFHGSSVGYLSLSDGAANDSLGYAVAVTGSTVVGTALGRETHAADAGSAVIFSPLLESGEFETIADRNDAPPNAQGTVFNTFDELAVSPNGRTTMRSGLVGPGSLNGKNSGVWSNGLKANATDLALLKRTGVALNSGRTGAAFARPVSNENAIIGFQALTSGPNITAANDTVYALWDGRTSTFSLPLVEGETGMGNGLLSTFQTPRMSDGALGELVTTYTNRLGGAAKPSNDSGLVTFDKNGPLRTITEDSDSPVNGVKFGQFLPRSSFHRSNAEFATFLRVPTSTDNMGVFRLDSGGNVTLLARKGASAPSETGGSLGKFTNFLAEVNSGAISSFRATIAPTGSSGSLTEGIWSNRLGPVRPVILNAKLYGGLPQGTSVKSVLRYGFNADNDVLAWVRLQGPGITEANDGAVILSRTLVSEPGRFEVLLREGFPTTGCSGARVASIQKVDHDYQGAYAILATLVVEAGGATMKDNQVLLLGRTTDGTPLPPCTRKPRMGLRKGMRFLRAGAQTVNSIRLPGFITDSTGGLDTGLAHVVRNSFGSSAASAVVLFGDGSGGVMRVFPGY